MSDTNAKQHVAVVGAGMSGMAAATHLSENGYSVTVFDKGRGAGGRMARRRADAYEFDHGAQYFTVRHPEFERQVVTWRAQDVVALWNPRLVVLDANTGEKATKPNTTARYVGVPGMNAPVKHLAAGHDVRYATKIVSVRADGSSHTLTGEDGAEVGLFDAVILAVTPEQAREILPSESPLIDHLGSVELSPCWSVMAVFNRRLEPDFDAAFVHGSPLGWAARNCSKQGRPSHEAWTLHATPRWSQEYIDREHSWVQETLVEQFLKCTRFSPPVWAAAHRWRYAQARGATPSEAIVDGSIGICGDWCVGSRVEDAYLSGRRIAERLATVLRDQ